MFHCKPAKFVLHINDEIYIVPRKNGKKKTVLARGYRPRSFEHRGGPRLPRLSRQWCVWSVINDTILHKKLVILHAWVFIGRHSVFWEFGCALSAGEDTYAVLIVHKAGAECPRADFARELDRDFDGPGGYRGGSSR